VVKVTQVEANNGKVYIVSNNKLQELTKKAVNTVYDFKQQTALLAVSDAKIAILTRKGVLTSNDSGKTFK
jgi:ABC-type amino acid transport system permease subunit